MQQTFSIGDALSFAWRKTVDNFSFLILATLCFFVIEIVISQLGDFSGFSPVFRLANVFVTYFCTFAFVRIGLKLSNGEQFLWKDIFRLNWFRFGHYILASILTMIITSVGFVLFIIPGIIATVRLGFVVFALVSDDLTWIKAIKRSYEITRGQFWQLLGFSIVLALINLLGFITLGIGALFTVPFSIIATVHVYDKLKIAFPSAMVKTI